MVEEEGMKKELEDLSDEELEHLEAQVNADLSGQQESVGSYGYPESPMKDSSLKFFRDVWKGKESVKVSNLNKEDMNNIRAYLKVAEVAEVLKLDKVGKYLRSVAEVDAATSMGLKGFFAQLIVTQIKKEQKVKAPSEFKKGFFGYKKTTG